MTSPIGSEIQIEMSLHGQPITTANRRQVSYLIYRKGSNSANQPMKFGWVPVFCCEAISQDRAIKAALATGLTCYNNQILEARPASKCSKADCQAAGEATEAEKIESEAFQN